MSATEVANTDATVRPARPRVAILVVNGFSRRGPLAPQREAEALAYPWIEVCLRQIARHSRGWDYEVLVFDNSHFRSHREMLDEFERVRVLPSRLIASIGRFANRIPIRYFDRMLERSHPGALDHMVRKVSAQFDYIVTLDNDSFPVRDDWLDVLVSECERGAAVSGVYRDEMAPAVHPFIHVSGLCVGRSDLRALDVSFGRNLQFTGEQDVERNQDVGQKITYEFIRRGRAIGPLRRSNKVNLHFLVAGIYGDVIYHHGAGGRPTRFRGSERSDLDASTEISRTLRELIFQDVDHLMAVLRGETANDLGLTPL